MTKANISWIDILKPITIDRTDRSQLRFSVIRMEGDDVDHIAIREFTKYIKKGEQGCGLWVEDMPYRATANGLTFRVKLLDEVIGILNDFKKELVTEKPI